MATIVTRSGKGSALTYAEADANFTNLNTAKIETSEIGVTVQPYDSNLEQFLDVFDLPVADSTAGYVLSTDGAGNLDFIAQSGGVTSVTATSPVTSTGGATPVIAMPAATTSVSGYLTSTDWNTFNNKTSNTGTVTSVSATVPTGLTVTGSPITTTGTIAITYTAGYSIPTTASQTNWDSAYTQMLQWDGGSTNLVAATGRTSLGATTVGGNFFTLTNPSAITFPRMNADNTVSALDATTFRTAIGAGTGSGTVTSVTGTAPVVSSGGATPAISMAAATTSVNGYLTSADWTTFNSKAPATSGTSILYGNGSGGFSNVTIGTNLTFSGGTLNATGGGGGGLTGFTSAYNTSSPNATVPVSSLSATGAATDIDVALIPKGTGAILAAIPDNTTTGGDKRGEYAVDLQTLRGLSTQVASGNKSVISGGSNNTASGLYSVVSGGNNNIASGLNSAVSGGYVNTASGEDSYIAGGYGNTASGYESAISNSQLSETGGDYSSIGGGYSNTIDLSGYVAVISGGENNTASDQHTVIAGGYGNNVSGDYAVISGGTGNTVSGSSSTICGGDTNEVSSSGGFIGGGYGNTLSGNYSSILGGLYANDRGIYGTSVRASGYFAAQGDAQVGSYIARRSTTTNTATVLTFDNLTPSTNNQLILPNDSTYFFKVMVVARRTDADNESASYTFEGCVDRNTNAASTALVGTPVKTILAEDTTAWDVSVSADTTNGGLAITVTGENSKTIRWVARIETTEVVG